MVVAALGGDDETSRTLSGGVPKYMSERDVVVLSAVRSAIGKFGGGLSTIPATELGALIHPEHHARVLEYGSTVMLVPGGHVTRKVENGSPRIDWTCMPPVGTTVTQQDPTQSDPDA